MTREALAGLEELLAHAPRGPARDGIFAIWLTARAALDLQLDPPLSERTLKRRLDALEARVARLRIAAPLRRALAGIFSQLRDPVGRSAPMTLSQLVAPVKETLGVEVSEALGRAVRAARRAAAS